MVLGTNWINNYMKKIGNIFHGKHFNMCHIIKTHAHTKNNLEWAFSLQR
jgi:hypothetical protein